MVMMSSQGANKDSWFLYPQTKVLLFRRPLGGADSRM
jgi:hypothetical protein